MNNKSHHIQPVRQQQTSSTQPVAHSGTQTFQQKHQCQPMQQHHHQHHHQQKQSDSRLQSTQPQTAHAHTYRQHQQQKQLLNQQPLRNNRIENDIQTNLNLNLHEIDLILPLRVKLNAIIESNDTSLLSSFLQSSLVFNSQPKTLSHSSISSASKSKPQHMNRNMIFALFTYQPPIHRTDRYGNYIHARSPKPPLHIASLPSTSFDMFSALLHFIHQVAPLYPHHILKIISTAELENLWTPLHVVIHFADFKKTALLLNVQDKLISCLDTKSSYLPSSSSSSPSLSNSVADNISLSNFNLLTFTDAENLTPLDLLKVNLDFSVTLPKNSTASSASSQPHRALESSIAFPKTSPAGYIWVWGSNKNYQLGILSDNLNVTPTRLEIEGCESRFIQMATAKQHSLFLTETGKIYSVGINADGRLGHGHTETLTQPKQIDFLYQKQSRSTTRVIVTKVFASSNTRSACITDMGTFYEWGNGILAPKRVNFPFQNKAPITAYSPSAQASCPPVIVDAAVADVSTLVVTNDGAVYAWGSNSKGQLGFDLKACDSVDSPKLVSSISHLNVKRVALSPGGRCRIDGKYDKKFKTYSSASASTSVSQSGYEVDPYYSGLAACITLDGQVYTWGGLSPNANPTSVSLRKIKFFKWAKGVFPHRASKIIISDVKTLKNGFLALSTNGELFAWNSYDTDASMLIARDKAPQKRFFCHISSYSSDDDTKYHDSNRDRCIAVDSFGCVWEFSSIIQSTCDGKTPNTFTPLVHALERKVFLHGALSSAVHKHHTMCLISDRRPDSQVSPLSQGIGDPQTNSSPRFEELLFLEDNETTEDAPNIPSLFSMCKAHLSQNLTMFNALEILEGAALMDLEDLFSETARYVIMNFDILLLSLPGYFEQLEEIVYDKLSDVTRILCQIQVPDIILPGQENFKKTKRKFLKQQQAGSIACDEDKLPTKDLEYVIIADDKEDSETPTTFSMTENSSFSQHNSEIISVECDSKAPQNSKLQQKRNRGPRKEVLLVFGGFAPYKKKPVATSHVTEPKSCPDEIRKPVWNNEKQVTNSRTLYDIQREQMQENKLGSSWPSGSSGALKPTEGTLNFYGENTVCSLISSTPISIPKLSQKETRRRRTAASQETPPIQQFSWARPAGNYSKSLREVMEEEENAYRPHQKTPASFEDSPAKSWSRLPDDPAPRKKSLKHIEIEEKAMQALRQRYKNKEFRIAKE